MLKMLILLLLAALTLTACVGGGEEAPPEPIEIGEALSSSVSELLLLRSEEDLLLLKTDGYQLQSVEAFDRAFAPYQYLYSGFGRDDPEEDFKRTLLHATMELLGEENGTVPYLSISDGWEQWGADYTLRWEIPDKARVTVEERDAALCGCQEAVVLALKNLNGAGTGDVDVLAWFGRQMEEAVALYSTELIRVEVEVEAVHRA